MLLVLIRIAGLVHLIFIAANLALPRILDFDGNLKQVPPIIRQIFVIHHAYIMLILGFFACLCLFFTRDLAGGSRLGTVLAAFMAVFWLARIPIQFFFYDERVRREHPTGHYAFSFALISLSAVLSAAALRGLL
jgi:hypothetical protein